MLTLLNYDQLPEILGLAVLRVVERLTIASVIPNASNRGLLVSAAQKEAAHAFLREAQDYTGGVFELLGPAQLLGLSVVVAACLVIQALYMHFYSFVQIVRRFVGCFSSCNTPR